jgi:mannose-6-phosphate isomerase-like protein (cupin superfamily)
MSSPTSLWGRIRPSEVEWQEFHDPHGRPTSPVRALTVPNGPNLLQATFPPNFHAGLHWHPYDTIYLFTAGEMIVGGEGSYKPGDIRWVKAGHVYGPEEAGPGGVEFFLLSQGGEVGLNWADLYDVPAELAERASSFASPWGRVNVNEVAWEDFPDPAGRPTQPVQVLAAEDPYILRTRFVPDYIAGQHWHDFDTVYFVTAGSMQFGPQEPWYEAGDIRWVKGGHAYGPEQPGPEGVEFILISIGGPVNLHWADLEAAPKGILR